MIRVWTDNPLLDFHRHNSRQFRHISRLPECCRCDESIQDEHCYEINGEYIDEECLDMYHKELAPLDIKCSECKKHIQDEESEDVFAYHIDDEWICEECMEENHRKLTEDLME